ncbi:fungal fucose-specific lectin-domain-containing protein [Crepidotus variabilis]|uniref:Fungal fucose-specific lectin-domain-containing protein n=1 Tax=Crepidotus variabilis TaxID=179855 RepID=A0A9P6EJB4_9AGAR|nr:fungal fucose-specific lectin-domain-containing protein [Crepidotus variabilis]
MSNPHLNEMLPGTAIAVTALSTSANSIRLYFQDSDGGVREFGHSATGWNGGTTYNVKFQSKMLSPIAVTEWLKSSKRHIRIYSLNRAGYLTESAFDEDSNRGWYGGIPSIRGNLVQPAPYSRISTVSWDGPLRVYYQAMDNKIQEIQYGTAGRVWSFDPTIPTQAGRALEGTEIAAIGWQNTNILVYFQGEDLRLWVAAHENKRWTHHQIMLSPKAGSPIAAVQWYDTKVRQLFVYSRSKIHDQVETPGAPSCKKRRIRIYFVTEANFLEEWCQDDIDNWNNGWIPGRLSGMKIQVAPYSKISAVCCDSKIRIYIQSYEQVIKEWVFNFGGYLWDSASTLNPTPARSKPIDTMGDTYSVGYLPWILDLQSWRTYDPCTIDGVGILVGYNNGRLVGDELKTCRSVTLQPNAPNTSYTWVYTPEGAIFYRLWEHDHRNQYVPSNQIAIAGEKLAVICAGEFCIAQAGHLTSVLVLINNVNGYVETLGSRSLGPVAVKLGNLGIDLTRTSWYYNSKPSAEVQDGR